MKSKESLWEICKEIYRELFRRAEPKADFDKMVKSGEAKQPEFFMRYYMPDYEQQAVIDEIVKQHKLSAYDIKSINTTVHLGCSPNTCLKTWKEHIKTGDLT